MKTLGQLPSYYRVILVMLQPACPIVQGTRTATLTGSLGSGLPSKPLKRGVNIPYDCNWQYILDWFEAF
jgi:hypothetical protein